MVDNPYRLPRQAVPTHYDLRLEPDLTSWAFDGQVSITLGVVESLDTITLNVAEIEIARATVDSVEVTGITYDTEYERATLTLAQPISPGTYTLEIEYTGIINDQLRGLYRSSFKDADGNEHAIATSQCQSTDARRVFP